MQIDWSGIRAHAIAGKNIREAARQAAANLPPIEQQRFVQRVLKRAAREQWLSKAIAISQAAKPINELPMSSNVSSGSDALATELAKDGEATRIAWSRAGRKAAEHFAKLKPSVNTKRAIAAKNWHSVAAGTHGWREREGDASFTLNVLNLGSLGVQVRQGDDEPKQVGSE